jgi:hypothetical protein
MKDPVIRALLDIKKDLKKPKKIKDLGIFDQPVEQYNYINKTVDHVDINKKINVISMDFEDLNPWKNKILKTSFDNFHENYFNTKFYFLRDTSKNNVFYLLNNKNTHAAYLYLLKNLVESYFDNEDYIFLIDKNFFFLSNVNKLIFNQDFSVSFALNNIYLTNVFENIIDIVHFIIDITSFYEKKICKLKEVKPKNIKLYGLPIYMKKKLFLLIIDRWIELTILLSENIKPKYAYLKEVVWLMAFSLVLNEYNIIINDDKIIDINYTTCLNSEENNNYILYNYKNNIFSIYNNCIVFDNKKYTPWSSINYKEHHLEMSSVKIFTKQFNFIVNHIIKCLSPIVKSV